MTETHCQVCLEGGVPLGCPFPYAVAATKRTVTREQSIGEEAQGSAVAPPGGAGEITHPQEEWTILYTTCAGPKEPASQVTLL